LGLIAFAFIYYTSDKSRRHVVFLEWKIQKELKYWKELLNTLPLGILITNETQVTYANKHFIRILSLSTDNLNDYRNKLKTIFKATDKDEPQSERVSLHDFLFNSKDVEMEETKFVVDSDERSMQNLSVKISKYKQSKNNYNFCIVLDQTPYDELETEKLRREYQKNFFAMLAHELRNPLHGILGIMESFSCNSFSPDIKKLAKVGNNTGQLMMSLINDILDLSQIEANKFKISLNQFSPEDTIKECIDIMKTLFERKKLKLNYVQKERLSAYITNDKNRYKQIILNLLSNALKFTIKGQVDVKVRYEENMLITKIRDTGTGMKYDKGVDLFSLYEKLDSNMKINSSGTGLGLPICKRLAESMGGTIRIKSIPNKGTTVKFSIEDKKTHNFVDRHNDEVTNTEEVHGLEGNEYPSIKIRKSITLSATNPYKDYWKIKEVMKVLVVDDDYTCAFALQSYFKSKCMICDLVYLLNSK